MRVFGDDGDGVRLMKEKKGKKRPYKFVTY
jgi:hypothetical protein